MTNSRLEQARGWSVTVVPDVHTVTLPDGEIEIYAKLIGQASSHGPAHTGHDGFDFARARQRCSKCRWFDVRIFQVVHEFKDECDCGASGDEHAQLCGACEPRARYLVATQGLSIVPGDTQRRAAEWTDHPYRVLSCLVQVGEAGPFLPRTSRMAVASAASCDPMIERAFINLAAGEKLFR